MIILGIDPGYAIVGYGIIQHHRNKSRALAFGAITTPKEKPLHRRLEEIYRDVGTLLDRFKPDAVAVEELFFSANKTTGIQVAHARGVLLLACTQRGLDPYEYKPMQVKQAVVGYGKAEKKQVMEMTRVLLELDKLPRPDDAADALAVAICHAHSAGNLLHRL